MAGWERAQAKKRMAVGGAFGGASKGSAGLHTPSLSDTGRTSEKLAAKTGVSARTVDKAIKVREAGVPEVNQAVASGEVTLNMAEGRGRQVPGSNSPVTAEPQPIIILLQRISL